MPQIDLELKANHVYSPLCWEFLHFFMQLYYIWQHTEQTNVLHTFLSQRALSPLLSYFSVFNNTSSTKLLIVLCGGSKADSKQHAARR